MAFYGGKTCGKIDLRVGSITAIHGRGTGSWVDRERGCDTDLA
jgi:hypothetical protein